MKISINRGKIATKEILCGCDKTLQTMNEVIYAGAYVMAEKLNEKPKKLTNRRVNKNSGWKEIIEKETNKLTGEVSILDKLIIGVKVKSRILNKMRKKYKMKKLDDVAPLKESLKQKI